jgi:hypothetical protein
VADFRHAFQLPANFLRALSAGSPDRGRGLAYRILEDRLHCDAGQVVLTHIFRPDESGFPPHFAAALVARLAAEFCIPITENTSRAQLLAAQAEAEFRAARRTDGQQATPRAIEDFPLIAVRG